MGLAEDVIELHVEIVKIQLVRGCHVELSSRRCGYKRDELGPNGADCTVVGRAEDLIAARASVNTRARVRSTQSIGVYSSDYALGGVENLCWLRHIDQSGKLVLEVKALIREKHERLVLLNRKPTISAKLIQTKRRDCCRKPVPSIEGVSVTVPKGAPVQVIRTAL